MKIKWHLTTILVATLGLLPASKIAAQSAFKTGDIFLDLSLGTGRPSGAAINVLKDRSFYQVEAAFNSSSSNTERMNLGLLQLAAAAETPSASSASGRLGFEYAFGDWFGFGVALNSVTAKVEPVLSTPFDTFGFFLTSLSCTAFTCPSVAPSALEYLSLNQVTAESEPFNTLDFDFNFHVFTTDVYDPYIRLTIGLGKVDDVDIAKLGLALGARYMISGNVYVLGELSGSAYSLVLSASESASGSSETVDAINNTEIRVGVGFKL